MTYGVIDIWAGLGLIVIIAVIVGIVIVVVGDVDMFSGGVWSDFTSESGGGVISLGYQLIFLPDGGS